MSGLLVGFIAVYGAMGPGLAGVFERLSTGANSLLSLLVLVRLLIQARGTAALDNAAMTAAVTAAP